MNWTLDQLLAFVATVYTGSFSAAARKLGKAQSRISTAVANLEADLGFELFDRSKRLPQLTAKGEEILPQAVIIIRQCERLKSKSLAIATDKITSYTIALEDALPITTITELLHQIANKFPDLRILTINRSQDDITKLVADKDADLGIVFSNNQIIPYLEFFSIRKFNYKLIVGLEHPLAKLNQVKIADLELYRQLLIEKTTYEINLIPISANYWVVDSFYCITDLVSKNIGWAFVPEYLLQYNWFKERVKILNSKFIDNHANLEVGVIQRRNNSDSYIGNWIKETLLELFAKEYNDINLKNN